MRSDLLSAGVLEQGCCEARGSCLAELSEMERKMIPFWTMAKKIKYFNLYNESLRVDDCKPLTFHEETDIFNAFEMCAIENGYTWQEQLRRLLRGLVDGDLEDTGEG
jgi:hypothetical protein